MRSTYKVSSSLSFIISYVGLNFITPIKEINQAVGQATRITICTRITFFLLTIQPKLTNYNLQ